MFNGNIVGPTIRVSPGDTFTITLKNNLPSPGFSTASLHNEYKSPDVTNLHTHGLHIGSDAPGDDVFTEVAAGGTFSYSYTLPANHMGGTFWYHPHHHGSTAVHAGGGASGMIIVNDAPGSIPAEVAALEEMSFFLQHLNMPELTAVAQTYEANCQRAGGTAAQCDDPVWANGATSGTQTNSILTNGMTQPVVSLVANRWYRWRIVYAAVDSIIEPSLPGCTVKLLAKDGVYLHEAPRDITVGYMAPGNRADWLALATVAVSAATEVACDLPVFRAGRPCYLADLRSTTVSKTATVTLGPVPNINGAPFSSPTGYDAATQMEVGTVNQLNLNGVNAHPFHLHINPYQIVADPANTHMGYFRAGDWHDVLMSGNNAVAVRLQTDTFVGKQVTEQQSSATVMLAVGASCLGVAVLAGAAAAFYVTRAKKQVRELTRERQRNQSGSEMSTVEVVAGNKA